MKLENETIENELFISKRVSNIEPSKTLSVDAKAKELINQGKDIVAFGAGEPDFATFDPIVQGATQAAKDPKNHKYSPSQGLLSLRIKVAKRASTKTKINYEPSNVLITNGSKHALSNVFLTLLDPGDEVVIIAPYWTSYPELIKLAGATPKVLNTSYESGFHLNIEEFKKVLSPKTRAVLINSPSNPTGVHYSPEEIISLGSLSKSHGFYIISDDIYCDLIYDQAKSYVPAEFLHEIKDQLIIIDGASKTYAMTGWRLGWIIAHEKLISACNNLQSHMTSNVANIVQKAGEAALDLDESYLKEIREIYKTRRDLIVSLANELKDVKVVEPDGAFYIFPCFENYLGASYKGKIIQTTQDLAEILLEAAGVVFVPGEAFGAPGYGRFSFATSQDQIKEGFKRLKEFLQEVN